MKSLKLCAKCTLPETYETIEFDSQGICNICHQQEYKQGNIDWKERRNQFDQLIAKHRGKYDYDCIVPFSGGKDSTYTLCFLVKEYKLKPLVIRFDHGFFRPKLEEYANKTFRSLGVDVLKFTPNWKVVKKLMLESLIRKGDFCWHCHTGIYSYPMHIAIKFKVPLILWGEPSAEYTAYYDYKEKNIEMVDEERFNRFINLGLNAEDMLGMITSLEDPVDPRDLIPYTYPKMSELRKIGCHSTCLGSYIPWNVKENVLYFQKYLPWWKGDEVEGMPSDLYPYEKIECFMQGIRDYIKYIKRGYGRVSQMSTLDIRHGRMTREDALLLIRNYEGKKPRTLPIFLDYLGLTEDQFNEIVFKTAIPPYEHDFQKHNELTPPLKDLDRFYREKGGIPE
ncbi:MAG: N-acetyl sugar amidotransferase [Candidatus Omnitrophota bacterium]